MSALDDKYASFDLNSADLRRELFRKVLEHPCMSATGRLPGFCLLHVGLRVRLMQTTESSIAVTDASGVVLGIEPDEREPKQHFDPVRLTTRPVVVLHYMP